MCKFCRDIIPYKKIQKLRRTFNEYDGIVVREKKVYSLYVVCPDSDYSYIAFDNIKHCPYCGMALGNNDETSPG